MAKRNKKHKRQATKRRKKSSNKVVERDLRVVSGEGVERWFRGRFSYLEDDGRKFWISTPKKSWKTYRKNQYRTINYDF